MHWYNRTSASLSIREKDMGFQKVQSTLATVETTEFRNAKPMPLPTVALEAKSSSEERELHKTLSTWKAAQTTELQTAQPTTMTMEQTKFQKAQPTSEPKEMRRK